MQALTRREFVTQTAAICAAGLGTIEALAQESPTQARHKMTMDLVCGAIGVSATQMEAVDLAIRHGFESVGADGQFLASISTTQLDGLRGKMASAKLVWGAANLPVEFRQDETKFASGLKGLPAVAAGLQRAGVTRISTWLSPCDGQLTYVQNFRQHASRLRAVANICKDQGLRLGLEYVGPKKGWTSRKFPFIHTMAEMRDLIAEINTGNVGLLLDSWHWYHAGDTSGDVQSLKPEDVVAVDLNDAPSGVPKDQQPDSPRELPCATGLIDVAAFLNSLNRIGYDGPVRVEPFNPAVNKMSKDDACAVVATSLKKAFSLLT